MDEIVLGLDTVVGTASTVLTIAARRYTANERAVYGTLLARLGVLPMSLEWQFGNGSIGIHCEIDLRTLSGPGNLTQIFGGVSPTVNPMTCQLFNCTPPAAAIQLAGPNAESDG